MTIPKKSSARNPPRPKTELMRTFQAAAVLGVSETTIRRWCKEGVLRHSWFQVQRRFRVSDLEAFVDRVMRGKL
jgi:excisionase family DNA binding protein